MGRKVEGERPKGTSVRLPEAFFFSGVIARTHNPSAQGEETFGTAERTTTATTTDLARKKESGEMSSLGSLYLHESKSREKGREKRRRKGVLFFGWGKE